MMPNTCESTAAKSRPDATPSSHSRRADRVTARSAFLAVRELVGRQFPLLAPSADDTGRLLAKAEAGAGGVTAIACALSGENVIQIQCRVATISDRVRCIAGPSEFLRAWGMIDGPVKTLPVRCGDSTKDVELWLELEVYAEPLTPVRESTLTSQLARIQSVAIALQSSMALTAPETDAAKALAPYRDHVAAVEPLDFSVPKDHRDAARQILDYISGGLHVALVAEHGAHDDYWRAVIASEGREAGLPVGRVKSSLIGGAQLIGLAEKVPGILLVGSKDVHLGVQTYQHAAEIRNLIARLNPVIWTGSRLQLQALFQGGQTEAHDPLTPIIVSAPDVDLGPLTRYAVHTAARSAGGAPAAIQDEIAGRILSSLDTCMTHDRPRLVPILAAKALREWQTSGVPPDSKLQEFARRLAGRSETFGGIAVERRVQRCAALDERLRNVFHGGAFLAHVKQHLFCQDVALAEVARRLRAEALTRDPWQPVRICLQGGPGCGKSQTAALIARLLNLPYVNIDAASVGDQHSALSLLLGAGRGIVHSEKCGRLQEAANHHPGAVIEISDLDHAPAPVRSVMGDVFLQALETGEAQSAMGTMFSCANLIFVFTLNLPNGADETVRKKTGFSPRPTRHEVRDNVIKHMKDMISSAFLSRVGTPILFDPLDGDALVNIAERSLISSAQTAAARLGLDARTIQIDREVSETLVKLSRRDTAVFGARALVESCRQAVADACARIDDASRVAPGAPLRLRAAPDGSFVLEPGASEPEP